MQSFKIIGFIFLLVVSLSCEKVIEVDIRDADMKYVIEGVVTDEPGVCKVLLSRTKKYNENNAFTGISGAIIKINDNGIDEYTLVETAPGVYETSLINGIPGHVYRLSVSVNSQVFTAISTMHQGVPLDTMYITRGPFGQHKFPIIAYTDPAGINNGYRFIQYVNGVMDPAIFWDNDEFTDGQRSTLFLDNGIDKEDDPRSINTGDVVTVELLSLDDPMYRFWSTLQFGGGDGSGYTASPANPVSNIRGGALGYFSAHAVRKRTVVSF